MGWYEWLLVLHVLAAFALVAGIVYFSVLIVAGRNLTRPSEVAALFRGSQVGDALFGVGSGGTILFGVWLAIYVDGYEVWDPWILAAIVLWAVAMRTGQREGQVYSRARDRARELVAADRDEPSAELTALIRRREGLLYHTLSSALVLAILILMIFKPGA